MGKEYTFCEIREKDVINVVDGRSLGRAVDIAFTCRGQVFGIIVPGNTKFLKGLTSNDSLFIPWRNVIKIGTDAVLVELSANGANYGRRKFRRSPAARIIRQIQRCC